MFGFDFFQVTLSLKFSPSYVFALDQKCLSMLLILVNGFLTSTRDVSGSVFSSCETAKYFLYYIKRQLRSALGNRFVSVIKIQESNGNKNEAKSQPLLVLTQLLPQQVMHIYPGQHLTLESGFLVMVNDYYGQDKFLIIGS